MRLTKAFTLAEVLITVAIIGTVAALTIPALVQKYQERSYVTGLKKAFSVLNNAYRMAIIENGDISKWEFLSGEYELDENGNIARYVNSERLYERFKPYLKVIKECKSAEEGCFTNKVKYINTSYILNIVNANAGARKFVTLADGMNIGFLYKNAIYVDVNGLKRPNTVGIDIFQLPLLENGIGFYDDMSGAVQCYTNEWTCSSWVLRNDNLDYLHCKDLSWTGKRKCSDK